MKKYFFAALALLTLILAACGESPATASQPTPTPTLNQPTPTPTPAQTHHKLKEPVQVYAAWKITVLDSKIESEHKSGGVTLLPSDDQSRFLILTVQMQNTAPMDQTIISNAFSLTGIDGVEAYNTSFTDLKPIPDHPVLAQGLAKFDLAYEISKTQDRYLFMYQMPAANANTPGENLFVWDILAPIK